MPKDNASSQGSLVPASASDIASAVAQVSRTGTIGPLDPQTGVVLPISLTPPPAPVSGDTSVPLVATAAPPAGASSWKNYGKSVKILDVQEVALYFWVTTAGGIQVYPVDPLLYSYDVSFPTEGIPTGLLLVQIDGDAVIEQASQYSPHPLESLYVLVFLSTPMVIEEVQTELSGYGIIPVLRST